MILLTRFENSRTFVVLDLFSGESRAGDAADAVGDIAVRAAAAEIGRIVLGLAIDVARRAAKPQVGREIPGRLERAGQLAGAVLLLFFGLRFFRHLAFTAAGTALFHLHMGQMDHERHEQPGDGAGEPPYPARDLARVLVLAPCLALTKKS